MKFSVLNTEINIGSSFYNFNIFHDQKYIMDDTSLKCGANSLHQFPVIKHSYFFPIIFILKIRRFPSFFISFAYLRNNHGSHNVLRALTWVGRILVFYP